MYFYTSNMPFSYLTLYYFNFLAWASNCKETKVSKEKSKIRADKFMTL